jgi:hypothetical protein
MIGRNTLQWLGINPIANPSESQIRLPKSSGVAVGYNADDAGLMLQSLWVRMIIRGEWDSLRGLALPPSASPTLAREIDPWSAL